MLLWWIKLIAIEQINQWAKVVQQMILYREFTVGASEWDNLYGMDSWEQSECDMHSSGAGVPPLSGWDIEF